MQELHTGLRAGTIVSARGDNWLVLGTRMFAACVLVLLEGRGTDNTGRRLTLVSPFDAIAPPARRPPVRRRRHTVVQDILGAVAGLRPGDGLWAATRARLEILPWQLAPALAVLRGTTRLLLADTVGLGKTVQAAFALAELIERGLVEQALVLTPPGLRDTWASELSERFGLDVAVVDQAALVEIGRRLPVGANPWTTARVVVASIDFVKQPEVRASIDELPVDLVIVDEAHHLTPGTDRGALVARLARRVPWVILVSATPHSGNAEAFRSLLDMGRVPGDRDPMPVFRQTRRDAALSLRRSTHVLGIAPTPAERALLDGLQRYARALWRLPHRAAPGVRLVASVLLRRATSSALAAERTLQRRLAALSGDEPPLAEHQQELPWLEHEDDGDGDAAWLGQPGFGDVQSECRELTTLIGLAHDAAASPSKLRRLERLVGSLREPVIVFTEFRDSLDACLSGVDWPGPVVCLHGGLDARARREALRRFLQGDATVLLATDVAGEGLSLHARARTVITVEWPWSPQRLEQRIGRVDRLGQHRRVHAVHLTARGTYEDVVVARLVARAARAAEDLRAPAEGSWDDTVLDAVVGDTPAECDSRTLPPGAATPPSGEAAREANRLTEQRRLARRWSRPASASTTWALPSRRARRSNRVVVVIEVARRSPAGCLEWATVVPVAVMLVEAPANRRDWKSVCRALARDARVHQAAVTAATAGARTAGWQPVIERLRAIRETPDERPCLVQPSLFDRRALRSAAARAAAVASRDARLAHLSALLARNATGDTDTRVIAVLPLGAGGGR